MPRRHFIAVLCFGMMWAMLHTSAQSQSMSSAIKNLTGQAAQSYIRPVVTGLNANLNSGWFHSAPEPVWSKFHFEVGVVMMATIFKGAANGTFANFDTTYLDSAQVSKMIAPMIASNFSSLPDSTQERLNNQFIQQLAGSPLYVTILGPTVIGSKGQRIRIEYSGEDAVTYTNPLTNEDTTIYLAGQTDPIILPVTGYGFQNGTRAAVPLVAPQITIGTYAGSQITLRYFNAPIGDAGKFKYFGWAIQHNPAVWFDKKLPVDMAISYLSQSMDQKYIHADASAFGWTASKTIGWRFLNITPYAGYLKEWSSTRVDYTYLLPIKTESGEVEYEELRIRFKEKGLNSSRLTLGTNVRFGIVNVFADYSKANVTTFSGGVMLAW